MTIQHSALTDTQGIHEPKGHLTAAAGTAYVSDGAASGAWVKVQRSQAACLKATAAGATTGVTTAYQALNNAALGGTIAWTQNTAAEMTTDTTSGYVVIPETGTYHITFMGNLIPATNGSIFRFTFGKDSGAGIVSQEAFVETVVTTSGTVDSNLVAFSCLPSVTLNDKIYIMVKETTAGEEFTLQNANFIITRVV
jgi:hypothetical protein